MGNSTIRQMQIKREQVSQSNRVESRSKSLSKSKEHTLNDKGSISQWKYNSYEYATKEMASIFKKQTVRITMTIVDYNHTSWNEKNVSKTYR